MPISCNQLLYDNLLLLPKAISIAMPIANRNCYQLVIRCFSCIASCLISVSVYMTTFIVIWQPCANLLISWITIYMTTFVVVTDSIQYSWFIILLIHICYGSLLVSHMVMAILSFNPWSRWFGFVVIKFIAILSRIYNLWWDSPCEERKHMINSSLGGLRQLWGCWVA